ncbi:hypothetical protein BD309DRAFT_944527 [Dichomitus squalens]|nr:hypothetical protein BD309DRAFT_944527 [Dichomitus squalens]
MSASRCASASSSYDSFLAPGDDEASYAPLLVSPSNISTISEDLNPFASQSSDIAVLLSPGAADCPDDPIPRFGPTSTPPPPLPAEKDVESELRNVVDDLLRKKRAARDTLAEENTSLRAQVSLLQDALVQASAQPGSMLTDLFAALERERTLRVNAEDSRIATGKYLAEQVERISLQKALLEKTVTSFTHGRDFWRAKAIAALERCEALEEENVQVKTQLNAIVKKQDSIVESQISEVLREVAEERDRLKQLEDVLPFAERTNVQVKTNDKPNTIKTSGSKLDLTKLIGEGKLFGGKTAKGLVSYKITLDARRGPQQSKKERP